MASNDIDFFLSNMKSFELIIIMLYYYIIFNFLF